MKRGWMILFAVFGVAAVIALAAFFSVRSSQASDLAQAGYCQASAVTPQRIEAGKVFEFSAESAHPAVESWSKTFDFPGATFVRLHFQNFSLAEGDKLVISSLDGSQVWEYTGQGPNGDGDFWSFATDGESVKVELNVSSGQSFGFKVVEVGYGTISLRPFPTPEVVCGTEGREAVACHTNEAVVDNAQKPVARLLFTSGGSQYLCTGELVRGSNANTMITNAHCVDTQTEVSSVQAKFNYQYTSCGGSTLGTTTDYAGGSFLKTSAERYQRNKAGSGLDYTLFTLQGNPEATWGELIPTTASYSSGTQINFIQHGGGNPKQIGYWEDSAKTVRCKIDTINMRYGNAAPSSQAGYGCDSEGGSSGSAITRASDGKVIALHHYGGVSSSPCLNSGTMMVKICQNAGSLLQCDSN
jgi:V8-like Glu-specific endopeptidase